VLNTGVPVRRPAARAKAQGPHGQAARAEARVRAKMRRWYMTRTVDRIVDLMDGARCSCFPSCARGRIRTALNTLVEG